MGRDLKPWIDWWGCIRSGTLLTYFYYNVSINYPKRLMSPTIHPLLVVMAGFMEIYIKKDYMLMSLPYLMHEKLCKSAHFFGHLLPNLFNQQCLKNVFMKNF
jgi:hypothetical protein